MPRLSRALADCAAAKSATIFNGIVTEMVSLPRISVRALVGQPKGAKDPGETLPAFPGSGIPENTREQRGRLSLSLPPSLSRSLALSLSLSLSGGGLQATSSRHFSSIMAAFLSVRKPFCLFSALHQSRFTVSRVDFFCESAHKLLQAWRLPIRTFASSVVSNVFFVCSLFDALVSKLT
jgi:hypothetical protein